MGYFNKISALVKAAAGLLIPTLCLAQVQNIVVTSAASFEVGLPAPGSIGTIFCTGLNISGLVVATSTPLPYTLAGIAVTIGGAPAPLFAVAELAGYQQINLQVPSGAQPIAGMGGSYQVLIQQNLTQGTATATGAVPVTPGDFFRLPGAQYGIFQHSADYSLVTTDSPAAPGEILVTYLTGVGSPLAFSIPPGQPAPLSPVDTVAQLNTGTVLDTYNVVVNGTPIGSVGDPNAILFLGLAPGFVGVFQINFALPLGLSPGDVQITLRQTTYDAMFGTVNTYNSSPVLLPVQ
jgi:uncharacterized protein (TIGR03437 family)